MTGVVYSSLATLIIPKLRSWLNARPEAYAHGVWVTNKLVPNKTRIITVVRGPSTGAFDTLDSASLRVNIRDPDEATAEDLTDLTRAFFESTSGAIDGNPITWAKVTAGPLEIENTTNTHQWYFVVDTIRRGSPLT